MVQVSELYILASAYRMVQVSELYILASAYRKVKVSELYILASAYRMVQVSKLCRHIDLTMRAYATLINSKFSVKIRCI